MSPQHLAAVPAHESEPFSAHTISGLREACQSAGWPAEQVAFHLGISRTKLFTIQRAGDLVPAHLTDAAERLLVLAEAEERRLALVEETMALTLASWNTDVREWVRGMRDEGTRSASTIEAYRLHVSWLARDLAAKVADPWSLHGHAVEDWLHSTNNWSTETKRKVLVSLRAFYTWGVINDRCPRSPLAGLSAAPPKAPGPKARFDYPQAWHEPVFKYLDYLTAANRAPGTRRGRAYLLLELAQHFPSPWTVTLDDLVLFCGRPDLSPEYLKFRRAGVRGFYQWAEDTGAHPANMPNPATGLPTIRVPRALPRPAPDAAVEEAALKSDARSWLMISLAMYAGLRRSEISKVHTDDIGDDVLLVHGKGGHERLVPLHPDLQAQLRAELRRRREGGPLLPGWGTQMPSERGWLFPSPHADNNYGGHLSPDTVADHICRALPQGWTTHTLRHRFATQAYAVQRDLRAVQELLGHARPETTARYAAVPGESLRSAVLGVGLVTPGCES